jgi:hypothetical protein
MFSRFCWLFVMANCSNENWQAASGYFPAQGFVFHPEPSAMCSMLHHSSGGYFECFQRCSLNDAGYVQGAPQNISPKHLFLSCQVAPLFPNFPLKVGSFW